MVDAIARMGGGRNAVPSHLMPARIDLRETALADLLIDDEVADGIVAGLGPPRRGRSLRHGYGFLRWLARTGR